jgi:hypothetical protein
MDPEDPILISEDAKKEDLEREADVDIMVISVSNKA